MTSVNERGIFDMLALSTVNRWAIVDMIRPQSVAEHSYRVWVLVQDLYEVMFPVEHNSFERESTHVWALIHDSEEVYTGDIPSNVKEILEQIAPGICSRLKEAVLRDKMPFVLRKLRGLEGTLPAHLVKIAEIVESILYLREYGVNLVRRLEVENYLMDSLNGYLKGVSLRHQSLPWQRAWEWCRQCLSTPPLPQVRDLDPNGTV